MSICNIAENKRKYNTMPAVTLSKPGKIFRPVDERLYKQFLKPTDEDFGNYGYRNGSYYDINGCIARQSGMYCGELKVPIPIYKDGKYSQFGTDTVKGQINLQGTTNMMTCKKENGNNNNKDFNAVYIPLFPGGRKHNRTKTGRKRKSCKNTKRNKNTRRK